MRESRKEEFINTARSIASKHDKPANIHREALPTFVPSHIQDNVEMCYLKLGQHGWLPLANVDPGGSLSHPSFKMWYEHDESYNEEGAKRFKDSPRLYNYNKRAAQKLNPHRPDNTRALGEFRCWEKKVDKPMQDKITNVDGAVGRDGWRAHVTLGNGVVRWTDDVFDWQQSNMLNPTGVNENGKSMYIYPNEVRSSEDRRLERSDSKIIVLHSYTKSNLPLVASFLTLNTA